MNYAFTHMEDLLGWHGSTLSGRWREVYTAHARYVSALYEWKTAVSKDYFWNLSLGTKIHFNVAFPLPPVYRARSSDSVIWHSSIEAKRTTPIYIT